MLTKYIFQSQGPISSAENCSN